LDGVYPKWCIYLGWCETKVGVLWTVYIQSGVCTLEGVNPRRCFEKGRMIVSWMAYIQGRVVIVDVLGGYM